MATKTKAKSGKSAVVPTKAMSSTSKAKGGKATKAARRPAKSETS
jgi:hypothetical protein